MRINGQIYQGVRVIADAIGRVIGYRNLLTDEDERSLTATQLDHLTAAGSISGIAYDTSNRAIAWTIDGVDYTADYSPGQITSAGSDGHVRRVAVDPAGRISGADWS